MVIRIGCAVLISQHFFRNELIVDEWVALRVCGQICGFASYKVVRATRLELRAWEGTE
jgi:hypothetical protein